MRAFLLEMIGIALLQCIAGLIISDERFQKILKLICSAAMTLLLLSQVLSFDYAAYASALRQFQWNGRWDEASALAQTEKLNRRYIEQACESYILDKAGLRGIPVLDVQVSLAWNTDGFWYPVHAELTVPAGQAPDKDLIDVIQTDLGIASSEQIFREEGA